MNPNDQSLPVNNTKEYYDKLLKRPADAALLLDSGGKIVYASDQFKLLSGFDANELTDKLALDVLEKRSKIDAKFKYSILTAYPGNSITADFKLECKNGERVWVECSMHNFINIHEIKGIVIYVRNIDQRKQFEIALTESEDRFKAFMQSTKIITWMVDRHGNYLFVNKGFEMIFGIPAHEIIGKNRTDFFPMAVAEEYNQSDRDIIDKKITKEYFEKLPFADGLVHECWKTKFPVKLNDGSIVVGGMSIDVTEQRKTEKELEEKKLFLEKVIKTTPGIIYLYDVDKEQVIFQANNLGTNYYDLYHDELGKLREADLITEIIHPDDMQAVRDMMVRMRSCMDERIDQLEYRAKDKLGNWQWLMSQITVQSRHANGKPKILQGIAIDINEKKQIELNRDAIFDFAPDAIFIENFEGVILDANTKACKLQGMDKAHLIGKNIMDITPSTYQKMVWDNFKRMVENKTDTIVANSWYNDGKPIPIEIRSSKITFDNQSALLLHVRELHSSVLVA